MSAATWTPIRLPEPYSFIKARLVGGEILVHAEPPPGGGCRRIFARAVDSADVSAIEFGPDKDVVDFEHYPPLKGLFALVATRRDRSLYDLRLTRLDGPSRAGHTVFPGAGESKDLYPVGFMGLGADGRRLAMACGEMVRGTQTAVVRYFIFLVDPDSGTLERGPELLGAFF